MDRSKRIAVGVVGALVVLGAAFFLMQGDGSGPEGDSAETQTGDNDCETGAPGQQPGEWGGVICQQASGAASFTDTFPCQTPDQSAVAGSLANATAGTLGVTVEDATGTVVFEDTYNAGAHPVGEFVGEGEAGEWTVTVELSDDWTSDEFGMGAGCQNGSDGGDGGSGGSACQTTSDQEVQGRSIGQISCMDHQGEASPTATFDCPTPDEGSANWDADIQAGQAQIRIEDADGQAIVDETLEGEESNFASLQGGSPGGWTITAELTSDFEGSFNLQGQCPTG